MNPTTVLTVSTLIRDLIVARRAALFASVEITPRGGVAARFADGSAVYAQVAYLGSRDAARPSWPAADPPPARDVSELRGGDKSMRPGYFAGLLHHLLQDEALVKAVSSYVDAGLVGEQWSPYGLRVVFRDTTIVYVAVLRTSGDRADDPDLLVGYPATT